MRARQPDRQGFITRVDGTRIGYDVYGEDHAPTVLLLPTWMINHSMHWKMQVPVLARHHRVITVDGPGNGRSDRPADPAAYSDAKHVEDAIAVMEATGTQTVVVAGMSMGAPRAALLAATHADRVLGVVMMAPSLGWLADPEREGFPFDQELDVDEGWALFNMHAWRRDYRKFLEFFFGELLPESHSSKALEDTVAWGLESDPDTLIASVMAPGWQNSREEVERVLSSIACPALVIGGSEDAVAPAERCRLAAELTGADLLLLEGAGHVVQARHPVVVNRALLDFVDRVTPKAQRVPQRRTWTRALRRPKKVLYLSSPIGLGHARRDLAIAQVLRTIHEDLHVDWLAQHPVTAVLSDAGESVHPASAYLASESAHIEDEAHEHSLHAFEAVRRMDEILLSNFSVLQDVLEDGDYDLVIGDEAWDLDHFWHENPELKRSAYVWMTDFVGWLPMPEGGPREAALTADYNAEMLEHIARFKRVRDRSIFIGDPEDIVPDTFGPGLPSIRAWTEEHYDFSGYVTGFTPPVTPARAAGPPVVVATVGGSGVGAPLLRKVIEALPIARKEIDGLRMLAVAGPRIDPSSLPQYDGLDLRGYVPDLHLELARADAAVVQGGLTTTMELVAAGRPFVYFPLANHFEQQRHVRHRLERYGAGRCMDYALADPDEIAAALVEELSRQVEYPAVASNGAAKAAALVAELL
jgi:pimeloyl-ACP methyl ester carboxylesterase/predicted glycosyltransferase